MFLPSDVVYIYKTSENKDLWWFWFKDCICSMIQLGKDFNGIFDDGNSPKTLSRFQVKYPPSRNPYKCFPPSQSLNVPQPLTDRAAWCWCILLKEFKSSKVLLQIYLWNKDMLFNVYNVLITNAMVGSFVLKKLSSNIAS